jgi:hypothetical protein
VRHRKANTACFSCIFRSHKVDLIELERRIVVAKPWERLEGGCGDTVVKGTGA